MSDRQSPGQILLTYASLLHGTVTAWIVLAISLALTGAAWYFSQAQVENRIAQRFDFRTQLVADAVTQRMATYKQVLMGGIGLYEASSEVTRAEWREYVRALDLANRFPGIQGLGVSVPVPAAQKQAHVAAVRAEGFPDYDIRPTTPRDDYHSIIYLEPFDWRNKRAFGYDMYSNPLRRQAMRDAIDSGESRLSGVVTLVQETDKDTQFGFLLYRPLYKTGADTSTREARRKNFELFVYAAFRANDLMTGILGSGIADVRLRIYDGERGPDSTPFFDSKATNQNPDEVASSLERSTTLSIGGRPWTLRVTPTSTFASSGDYLSSRLIGGMGLLVDVLLFLIITAISKQRREAQQRSHEATRDLEGTARRLDAVVEASADAILVIDDEHRITFWNHAAQSLFDFPRNDSRHYCLSDLLTDDNDAEAVLAKAIDDAPITEMTVKLFNGTFCPVDVSVSRWQTESGFSHAVTLRDIRERQRIQAALQGELVAHRSAEQRFRTLVDLAPSALLVVNDDGRIQLANEQAECLFGYSAEALVHMRVEELIPQELRGKHQDLRSQFWSHASRRQMGVGNDDLQAQRSDGTKVYVEIGLSPIDTLEGPAVLAAILDVTDRRNTAAKLIEQADELSKVNSELEQFAYIASHDLKAPLRGVDFLLDLICEELGDDVPQGVNHNVGRMRERLRRMERMMEELLAFSRAGRRESQEEQVHLGALLRDISAYVSPRDGIFEIACDNIVLRTAKTPLETVLRNLMSNAIKHHDGEHPHITVSVLERDDELLISVRDDGPGIHPRSQPKIFEIFYHDSVNSDPAATGMGLAVVKRMVETAGGKVQVVSPVVDERGACFEFTWPLSWRAEEVSRAAA